MVWGKGALEVLEAGQVVWKDLGKWMFSYVSLILYELRNISKLVMPIAVYFSSLSPKHLLV